MFFLTEDKLTTQLTDSIHFSGVLYDPGTSTILPDTCETVSCSPVAVPTVTPTCGATQTCVGNNM